MRALRTSLPACLALGALAQPGQAQCEIVSPEIPTSTDTDWLGAALDAEGDRLVVGDPYYDSPSNAGALFVLEREAGTWTTVASIFGTTSFDKLGTAVDLDGDRILASALGTSPRAYLYERDAGGVWLQTETFEGLSGFGEDVALSGTTAAITDIGCCGIETGVRIFEEGPGGWSQVDFLQPPSGNAYNLHVAIDGERLVFANPRDETALNEAGSVFVYRRVAGVWGLEATLQGASSSYQELFGFSVAIDGERVLVGAPLRVSAGYHGGGADVFELQGGSWVQTAELVFPGSAFERHFGIGVALRGDFAAATWSLLPGSPGPAGGVITFRQGGGAWTLDGGFNSTGGNDHESVDHMSYYLPFPSVALAEGLIALGVGLSESQPDVEEGELLLQEDALDRATSFCGCSAGPCGNGGGIYAGCANSTGAGARLSTCGSTRVAWDDLEILGADLPPSKPGLLVMGTGGPAQPFGAGNLCLVGSAGVFRFPVASSNPSGVIAYGPGLVAHSQNFGPTGPIGPGDTRSFQIWYRDPQGPCGATFNLTNALAIEFTP